MTRLRLSATHAMAMMVAIAASTSCAIVPRESVELSTAVGRDVNAMHKSHTELVTVLFDRMKKDVNRFVDNVYAPYQIQHTLAAQHSRHQSGDKNNIFSVLELAMQEPQNTTAQKDVVDFMQAIVEAVHDDVEEYRALRLVPIHSQQKLVFDGVDRVFDQIYRGNAAVTAHLASIVKVNELQDELLTVANLVGLREKIGVGVSKTSTAIESFVDEAKRVDGALDQSATTVEELTKKLDALTKGE